MENLDRWLHQHFNKLLGSKDRLWQNKTILISGHLVPGEGEHKIMKFIREMKNEPDYNVNLSHWIYGEDADLLIMGMHNTKIIVIREGVRQF